MVSPRKRWSPAGLYDRILETIKWLRESGQSEAVEIGDFLSDNSEELANDPELALAILEAFAGWAQAAKDRLKGGA